MFFEILKETKYLGKKITHGDPFGSVSEASRLEPVFCWRKPTRKKTHRRFWVLVGFGRPTTRTTADPFSCGSKNRNSKMKPWQVDTWVPKFLRFVPLRSFNFGCHTPSARPAGRSSPMRATSQKSRKARSELPAPRRLEGPAPEGKKHPGAPSRTKNVPCPGKNEEMRKGGDR